MSAHLLVSRLGRTFGKTTALSEISLEVGQGEFLALLGPSGCGKTTLLRILAGLDAPDTGRVSLGGQDITRRPPWERDIGLVFQSYALFPHMTVRQNVGFGLEMRGITGAEAARRVDEALDIVSMRDFARRRPAQLSGGQQQRIAIARAIAIRPRLLLLDEPLSNLDAVLRQSVRVELRELHNRTGLTTVMVTHDQVEALSVADRIALMSRGRIEQLGSPDEIYEQPGTGFAAGFIGSPPATLLPLVPTPSGLLLAGHPWTPPPAILAAIGQLDGPARLALRPEALELVAPGTAHAIHGRLRACEYIGAEHLLHVETGSPDTPGPVLVCRTALRPPPAASTVALLPQRIAGLFDTASDLRLNR